MDDPDTQRLYRRERNRCAWGLAAGLTVVIAYGVCSASPGAQQPTGPMAWWQTLLILLGSVTLGSFVFVFIASVIGIRRLLLCEAQLRQAPWQPFIGDVAAPVRNQNLHSTFYLDDGSGVLKVGVVFWRERPLLQAATGSGQLWRCGEPGTSQVLMMPGHPKLYWARRISVSVLAKKTLADETGRLRIQP